MSGAERTGRGGRPTGQEELATAFRLTEVRTGSAILTLEAVTLSAEQEMLADVERLAVANLRAFMDAIEHEETKIDPAVAEAVETARRALGDDGQIVNQGRTATAVAAAPRH